jgi:hypothetical protein
VYQNATCTNNNYPVVVRSTKPALAKRLVGTIVLFSYYYNRHCTRNRNHSTHYETSVYRLAHVHVLWRKGRKHALYTIDSYRESQIKTTMVNQSRNSYTLAHLLAPLS